MTWPDWPDYRPPKPHWESPPSRALDDAAFARFVGELGRSGATAFEVVGCRSISPAGFGAMAGHRWTAVNLSDTRAQADAVAALEDARESLSWLLLSNTAMTSGDCASLAAKESLVDLGLSDCPLIDDAVMDTLVHCRNLVSLGLNRTSVTAEGIFALAILDSLSILGMEGISFAAIGPADVRLPPRLRALNASRCGLCVEHLEALCHLPLEELYIAQNPLAAADSLRGISAIPSLRRLSLYGCPVADGVVEALRVSPALELVDVRGTNVSADGIAALTSSGVRVIG